MSPQTWRLHCTPLSMRCVLCCCIPSVLGVAVVAPTVSVQYVCLSRESCAFAGPQAAWDLPLGIGWHAQHQPDGCVEPQMLWLRISLSLRTRTDNSSMFSAGQGAERVFCPKLLSSMKS